MLGNFSLTITSLVIFIFFQLPALSAFTDIPKGHWAEASIQKVTQDYQVMSGYPGNKFAGSRNLTRYEAATIINKIFENLNKEIDKDRKDLSSLLEVMELFQSDMKNLKEETRNKDARVEELNRITSSLITENQNLKVKIDSANAEIERFKAKEELEKQAKKPKKKKRFFFFGKEKTEKKEKVKKEKKTKEKKPKEEKKSKADNQKEKDNEKNLENSFNETEQMNSQPSTIDKELPQASPDYVDEYQR